MGCKATVGTDNGYIYKRGQNWLGDAPFGGLFLTQPLGVDVVTICRYITPPRLLVPESKVYPRQNYEKRNKK
jgi:hypothetical protein